LHLISNLSIWTSLMTLLLLCNHCLCYYYYHKFGYVIIYIILVFFVIFFSFGSFLFLSFLELDFGSWEIIRVVSVTQKNKEGFDLPCVWSDKYKLCGFLTFFFYVFLVLCCWFLYLLHDLRRFLNIVRISCFLNLLYFVALYCFYLFAYILCLSIACVVIYFWTSHKHTKYKKKIKKMKKKYTSVGRTWKISRKLPQTSGGNQNIQS